MALCDEDVHPVGVDQPDASVELADEDAALDELRDVRRYGGSPDLKSWLHRVRELRWRRLADDEELLDDRALDRVTQENEGPADRIVWQLGNSQTLHPATTGVHGDQFHMVYASAYTFGTMKQGSAESWRPFADVVTERKAQFGLSFRDLERKTRDLDTGRGLSAAYLVQLFNGNEDPVPRAIRLIAGALELAPEEFIEYRLHLIRDGLDERVDFERAVENLKLVESLGPDVPARLSAASPNGSRGRRRFAAAA